MVVFRRPIAEHGARTTNLAKCLLGAGLVAATVAADGSWRSLAMARPADLALVVLSGLVGLTLGDTALFAAVATIGASLTLLFQTLAPVFTAILATLMTGERLALGELEGGALILLGVATVVSERRDGRSAARLGGIALAVVAAFGQGAGVVLAKVGLATVPVLPATLLRLGAGAVGLVVIAWRSHELDRLRAGFSDRPTLRRIVPASVLGTYVAMLLMMVGIAHAPASVAALLLATTPIFGLLVEAVVDRRRPGLRGLAGAVLAVAGVARLGLL